MSDFFQNGNITTLARLGDRPVEALEDDLRAFASDCRVALVLPALYSEFEGVAMPRILERLEGADYLSKIVLSLDRASEEEFRSVRRQMRSLPVPTEVIWNDGPRIRAALEEIDECGLQAYPQGKGRGVWLALGLTLAADDVDVVACHDCDIVNYRREMVARLIYPLVHPELSFDFVKGYYARASQKLYGRVTRLFFTPFVRAVMSVVDDTALLRFLNSFRYALAGEFAMTSRLARRIRIAPTWGLEVSVLAEVYRNSRAESVCQVELAESYEHKHQRLSREDASGGLNRMVGEIAASLFGKLAQEGVVLDDATMRALPALYLRRAQQALDQFQAVASINGLPYDRHAEANAIETFCQALAKAQRAFREQRHDHTTLASWLRVPAALPGFGKRLRAAIAADNPRLRSIPKIEQLAQPVATASSW